jgi:hypothetical protein
MISGNPWVLNIGLITSFVISRIAIEQFSAFLHACLQLEIII